MWREWKQSLTLFYVAQMSSQSFHETIENLTSKLDKIQYAIFSYPNYFLHGWVFPVGLDDWLLHYLCHKHQEKN